MTAAIDSGKMILFCKVELDCVALWDEVCRIRVFNKQPTEREKPLTQIYILSNVYSWYRTMHGKDGLKCAITGDILCNSLAVTVKKLTWDCPMRKIRLRQTEKESSM